MDWTLIFNVANVLAVMAWIVLIAFPRWPSLLSAVLYLGIGLLCLIYAGGLVVVLSGLVPASEGGADFTTIEGVRTIFSTNAGVAIGWTHYLAFDLFVGLWIARDADAKSVSRWVQAPILLATFLAGPVGLFVWLLMRERRARVSGRWQ